MLLDELRDKKEAVVSIAVQYGAEDIRVFGSIARQKETEGSDMDIPVSLPRGFHSRGMKGCRNILVHGSLDDTDPETVKKVIVDYLPAFNEMAKEIIKTHD